MALFEGYERRIAQINKCLNENGIASIEEAEKICKDKGLDVYQMVKDIQTICFENGLSKHYDNYGTGNSAFSLELRKKVSGVK